VSHIGSGVKTFTNPEGKTSSLRGMLLKLFCQIWYTNPKSKIWSDAPRHYFSGTKEAGLGDLSAVALAKAERTLSSSKSEFVS